jgi:hypothetical protein
MVVPAGIVATKLPFRYSLYPASTLPLLGVDVPQVKVIVVAVEVSSASDGSADKLMSVNAGGTVGGVVLPPPPPETVTLALALALPPAPLQVMLYVVELVGETDWLPDVLVDDVQFAGEVALQAVALLLDQDKLLLEPVVIDVGLAARLTVGEGLLVWFVAFTNG